MQYVQNFRRDCSFEKRYGGFVYVVAYVNTKRKSGKQDTTSLHGETSGCSGLPQVRAVVRRVLFLISQQTRCYSSFEHLLRIRG